MGERKSFDITLEKLHLNQIVVFYDGDCGMCHRFVLFVLGYAVDKEQFLFAPLHGETFVAATVSQPVQEYPDSIVVLTPERKMLFRSEAVSFVLKAMGGFWSAFGSFVRIFPKWFGDFVYDAVAKVRKKIFPAPKDVCPMVPDELRKRFRA